MNPALERFAFGRPDADTAERARIWPALMVVGRALLATIFIMSGIAKFMDSASAMDAMREAGIPGVPFFLVMAAFLEVVAGLMLFTGTLTRLAALALFLYLIPVTLTMHAFWDLSGAERSMQQIAFLKNLAIMGGLLAVASLGATRYTVDSRLRRRRHGAAAPARSEPLEREVISPSTIPAPKGWDDTGPVSDVGRRPEEPTTPPRREPPPSAGV
jgi:putative oxidoreductase